jgi:DNA modification methylase
MVWSQALKGKDDQTRFKQLNWGIRTWDLWNFNDCDKRFGDAWPGRIPAQLAAHILYFFSKQDDLIFDPMAGGGVCSDTCLAMGRRCVSHAEKKDPWGCQPVCDDFEIKY